MFSINAKQIKMDLSQWQCPWLDTTNTAYFGMSRYLIRVGIFAGNDFAEHYAVREHISFLIILLPIQDLRCHPIWCANYGQASLKEFPIR